MALRRVSPYSIGVPAPLLDSGRTREVRWTLLTVAPPGQPEENAGVLLADGDHLLFRLRRDLTQLDPDNADILELLEDDLRSKADEMGAEALLEWLEANASGFFRSSGNEALAAEDPGAALNELYSRHVRPKVLPFRTHLPVYGLAAAAGRWGKQHDVEQEPEHWIEAPPDLRLSEDMFVARVNGRSMEPLIPDGSLCVFRGGAALAGSRQGRRVLVANYGEPGEQRFTVKRYESVREQVDEDRTVRTRIRLHPLNPEFESWGLDPESADAGESERVQVVGEFVCVLPPE